MTLADLQFSYRGLVFGAGTEVHVNRAEGFEGFDVRSSDADLPRGDGSVRGSDFVGARTLAFELAIIEYLGSATTYEQHWSQIRDAFRPARDDDDVLTFKRPGMPERYIRCRPVQLVRVEEYKRFNTVGFPPVVLRATDPRIYSAGDAHSALVPVFFGTSGQFELPAEIPLDFLGGGSVEAVVTNAGNAPAYPLVRVYPPDAVVEPVYYPGEDIYPDLDIYPNEPDYPGATVGTVVSTLDLVRLSNMTTGQVLEITAPVSSGQVLSADMEAAATGANRLVVSVDDESAYSSWQLPREPFALAPGANTLRLQVEGTTNAARCLVSWRDTWLD